MTDETAPPTPASVPKRRLDARVRNYRGVTMVAGGDESFELSETAAFVWRSLDDERSVDDIARLLGDEYDVDHETALTDVTELLTVLARAGVLTY
jgi:HEAT repeat protein